MMLLNVEEGAMSALPKWILLVFASAPLSALCAADATRSLKPDNVRSAMLVWDIGTNRPKGPTRYVETVTRVTEQNRQLWRITHYPHDIVATRAVEFDLYDVDAATLTPVRSVQRNANLDLAITFDGPQVSVTRKDGATESVDKWAVPGILRPEGPGLTVFVAGLPLQPGYSLEYQALDRWHGRKETKVKRMKLTVLERDRVATQMGMQDTLKLQIEPEDASFKVVEYVRAEAPHYPFLVEYTRGRSTLTSAVVAMAIAAD
jgi:hypothetical protein